MRAILTIAGVLILVSGGCKKPDPPKTPATPASSTPAPAATGGNSGGGGGGGGNTGYISGGGAVQNVRQAARRTVALNDMNTLGLMIEQYYTENGKMPPLNVVKTSLQRESPNILAAINEGTVILCWTGQHEGMWAYEIDADTKGGIAVVTGRAGRYDAQQVKQMLGK